ncbi:hypothetical protein ABZ918_24305, partial [Streptomyces viridosporus]
TTSARHHELGPVALALIKRNVPVDARLIVGGTARVRARLWSPGPPPSPRRSAGRPPARSA